MEATVAARQPRKVEACGVSAREREKLKRGGAQRRATVAARRDGFAAAAL
ncbi:phosphoesterase [Sesbania bispinosa]|nr:phosphoesterase [Sesbania bispinosa]